MTQAAQAFDTSSIALLCRPTALGMVFYLPSVQCYIDTKPANSDRLRAAQQAILRFNTWCDRTHLTGRNGETLHPNIIAFLKEDDDEAQKRSEAVVLGFTCRMFMQDSLKDILDAIVCLDRIDGGFSFFVRIPGLPPATEGPLKVNCYAPPRELKNAVTQQHVESMLQYFIDNIAFRHLQLLEDRFKFSDIKPHQVVSDEIKLPQFPSPTQTGGCCFQYSSGMRTKTDPATLTCRKCQFKSPKDDAPHGALLSIGPKTEKVIENFGIPDQILPHLRNLVRVTRSARWEPELHKDSWGLTAEEATAVAHALLEDLSMNPHLERHAPNFVDRFQLFLTFLTLSLLVAIFLV